MLLRFIAMFLHLNKRQMIVDGGGIHHCKPDAGHYVRDNQDPHHHQEDLYWRAEFRLFLTTNKLINKFLYKTIRNQL